MPPYVDWKPIVFSLLAAFTGGFLAGVLVGYKINKPMTETPVPHTPAVTEGFLFEAHVNCMRAGNLLGGDWYFELNLVDNAYHCKLWDKQHNVVGLFSVQEITTIGNFLSGMGVVK